MAFEWVAGLFQSDNQQARGLSGGSGTNSGGGSGIPLDDSNPYYNYRLRRHKAEGDLIADPGLLWYTSPYVKRRRACRQSWSRWCGPPWSPARKTRRAFWYRRKPWRSVD